MHEMNRHCWAFQSLGGEFSTVQQLRERYPHKLKAGRGGNLNSHSLEFYSYFLVSNNALNLENNMD